MLPLTKHFRTPSRIPVQTRGRDHGGTSAHNRLMVWEMLRQHGPQSRRQLSETSRLGNSTLTYLVRDLLALGLVRDKGKRTSTTVGKKQLLLEIDPDYGVFGGFFIEGGEVSATLINAQGQELDHQRLPAGCGLPEALDAIGHYLDDYAQNQTAELKCLGLAIPGIVDCTEGKINQSWRLDINDYPIAAEAERRWGLPVVVENDVKLGAWSEAEQLATDLPDTLLFLAINASSLISDDQVYGVGMSVIHHGQLMAGTHNSAGELRNLRELFGKITLDDDNVRRLRDPDADLTDSIRGVIEILGHMIATLADLFDPGVITLGGSLEIANTRFLEQLQERLAKRRIHQHCDRLALRPSTHGERGVAHGAAMLARRTVVREALSSLDKTADLPA